MLAIGDKHITIELTLQLNNIQIEPNSAYNYINGFQNEGFSVKLMQCIQ